MLTLNKYLINIIAQLSGYPHRLRVNKKLFNIIKIGMPHSIIYKNLRIFTPYHTNCDSENIKTLTLEEVNNHTYDIKKSKILIIYTHLLLNDDDIIPEILKVWNKKYALHYIFNNVISENIPHKKKCVLILGFDNDKLVVKFDLGRFIYSRILGCITFLNEEIFNKFKDFMKN